MLRAGFNLFWNEGQWELIPFLFWFLVTSPLVVFFVIPVLYLLDGRKKKSFQRLKNFPVALLSWEAIGNWIRGIVCLTPGESESEVAQSCPTLCDPMDCSPPGSSVHGIFQARILEWGAIFFSRRSAWPRDWTQVSRIVGRCFTVGATKEWRHLVEAPKWNSRQWPWKRADLITPRLWDKKKRVALFLFNNTMS